MRRGGGQNTVETKIRCASILPRKREWANEKLDVVNLEGSEGDTWAP